MNEAQLFLAAVAAILQAVSTWFQLKDRKAARSAGEAAYKGTLANPSTAARAARLMAIVPPETMSRLRRRVQECYDKFNRMLDKEDEFFDEDISKAGKVALPSCVCRNLDIIKVVNGSLPDKELEEAWERYTCESRLAASTNP